MKKNTKFFSVFLLTIFTAVLISTTLCSCSKQTNVKKVGVILPLTGDLAFLGDFMKNSLLLDTTDVTYIIEDCQGETKQAIMAANKLINKDKVSYIVSSLSFLSEAINPICKKKDIPHFILSFSPSLVDKENVIQSFVSTRIESEEFVSFIKNNHYKKVAFLRHQEPDATYGFERIIEPELKKMGVEIVDVCFNNATIKDFKSELLKINQAEPELLIIQSLAYNIPNIISAINIYNMSIPILGDINFLDIQDPQTMDLVEGIPFVGIESVLSPNYQNYTKKYLNKYKKAPFALGSFAYDLGCYLQFLPEDASVNEILSIINKTEDSSIVNNNKVRFNKTGQENVTCKILTFHNRNVVEFK